MSAFQNALCLLMYTHNMRNIWKVVFVIPAILFADQTVSTPQTTPIISNGSENITITATGAVDRTGNSSLAAIRIWGNNLQAGKAIINNGRLSTSLLSGGNYNYSFPILLFGTNYGSIRNNGEMIAQTGNSQNLLGYGLYVSTNGTSGNVINTGMVKADVLDNSWGVGFNVRNNNAAVNNAVNGSIQVTGRDDSWLYGLATINNNAAGNVTNSGVISTENYGDNGGSTGIYVQYNRGEITNSGSIVIQMDGQGSEAYGISASDLNDGIVRNEGSITIIGQDESALAYAFYTDSGSGTFINDTNAYAYGDIHTTGQLFENRGQLFLHSKTTSTTKTFHAYPGSITGIKVDLDNSNNPVYSNIAATNAILENNSGIFVDVQTQSSLQHLYIGQVLDGVIKTTNGLTVNGTILVADNSILLRFLPRYDQTELDLVIEKAMSIEDAVRGSRCNASAFGAANVLDSYIYGSDTDTDNLINTLYSAGDLQTVGNTVSSATPISSLQLANASLQISNALKEKRRQHLLSSTYDLNNTDIWIEALGMVQKQECSNGYRGYELSMNGVILGSDHYWNTSSMTGIALSFLKGDLDSNTIQQQEKVTRYDIAIYGSYFPSTSWQINYDLALGRQYSDISRTINGLSGSRKAKHDDILFSSYLELAYNIPIDQQFSASLGTYLSYLYIKTGSYAEEGAGGLNSTLDRIMAQSLRSGFKAGLHYKDASGVILGIEGGIDRDIYNHAITAQAAYRGIGNYDLKLDYDAPWNYLLSLNIEKRVSSTFSFILDYDLTASGRSYRNHLFSASLIWRF